MKQLKKMEKMRKIRRPLVQHAKKVMSDSLGLLDFAVGLVILFLTCPTGKCCFFRKIKLLLINKGFGAS